MKKWFLISPPIWSIWSSYRIFRKNCIFELEHEQKEEELKDQEKQSKMQIKNNLLSVVNDNDEFQDKMDDIQFTNQDLGSVIFIL